MARAEAERLEEGRLAGRALSAGVWTSGLLLAGGLLFHALSPEPWPAGPPRWGEVLRAAAAGHGEAMALLGIAALIATPYLRVVILCAVFARGRQWRMLGASSTVLALLLTGVLLGWKG